MSAVTKRGRANILTPDDFGHLLAVVQARSLGPIHTLRDFAILMLSYKGALRACEIAGLKWQDVTDVRGDVGKKVLNRVTAETEVFFEVPNGIAKNGRGRVVPMHSALLETLKHLKAAMGKDRTAHRMSIIQSTASWKPPGTGLSANALVQYLIALYEEAGLKASSHSGRRTALTQLAQTANTMGCSLFDVQRFAGHADVETTECYVEASPFAGRMVRSL